MILAGDDSHFFIGSQRRMTNGVVSQGWRWETEPSVTLLCLPRLRRGSSPLLPTVPDLLPHAKHWPLPR